MNIVNEEPDYHFYTLLQLYDARSNIDKDTYPERYQELLKELTARKNGGTERIKLGLRKNDISSRKEVVNKKNLLSPTQIASSSLVAIMLLIILIISVYDPRQIIAGKKCVKTADGKCTFFGYKDTDKGPAWGVWDVFFNFNGRGQKLILNADKDTFQILDDYFAKDKNRVYFHAGEIHGADPMSFEIVSGALSRDSRAAYIMVNEILGANPKTIKPLNSSYSTDGLNVYSGVKPLVGVDVATFKTVGTSIHGQDKYRCYMGGRAVSCSRRPFISQ